MNEGWFRLGEIVVVVDSPDFNPWLRPLVGIECTVVGMATNVCRHGHKFSVECWDYVVNVGAQNPKGPKCGCLAAAKHHLRRRPPRSDSDGELRLDHVPGSWSEVARAVGWMPEKQKEGA